MSKEPTNPKHQENKAIRIGSGKWFDFRHPNSGDFSNQFSEAVNGEKLAMLLLTEQWHQEVEIIPNYSAPFGNPESPTQVNVRVKIYSDRPNQEMESYAWLRYSKGPKQGFFWDIYGDDMQSFELAILALHQAPPPYYCGGTVFKLPIAE